MITLFNAIAVGTGTWGIEAVIPKYLSLRLLVMKERGDITFWEEKM
jgi:hypothetical protein